MPAKPTLEEAIAAYQRDNPYSKTTFEGLFPYLKTQGFRVARTTHANNSLASDDALVTDDGRVFDLVIGSSEPNAQWAVNSAGTYDPSRHVVGDNGRFIPFSEWAAAADATSPGSTTTAPAGGRTLLGSLNTGTGGVFRSGVPIPGSQTPFAPTTSRTGAVYRSGVPLLGGAPPLTSPVTKSTTQTSSETYAAAAAAAARQRGKSRRGGRSGTILGGFGAGTPSTRLATALGRLA